MPSTILVGNRIVRDGRRELGITRISARVASELAGDGIGLFIDQLAIESQIRTCTRIARNCLPSQTVIVTHSWEAEEEVSERCQEMGLKVLRVEYLQRKSISPEPVDVVVAIPEKLYVLQPLIRTGLLTPQVICMMDPHGSTAVVQEWEGRHMRRADNIGQLRAMLLATGVNPLVFYLCGLPARSICCSALQRSLGVEALQFLQGQSLRLSGLDLVNDEQGDISNTQPHWLDAPVTASAGAMSPKSILIAGSTLQESDDHLREYARIRGYPTVDVGECIAGTLDPQLAAQKLRHAVQLVNKRVVILVAAGDMCRGSRLSDALRSLSLPIEGTAVLASAPDGWNPESQTWDDGEVAIAPGSGVIVVTVPQ